MSNPRHTIRSRLHRLGVAGPARVRASDGTRAPKIAQGTGAPSPRRALAILPLLATTLGALAFTAAPALAAAPEAPTTEPVVGVTATAATFEGVLNPGGAVEAGTYEFLYNESETTCEGGSHAPVSPVMYLGSEPERVSQPVTGLKAGATYTVCLRAETAGGKTVGTPVTFTTVPTPHTEAPGAIGATTATFKGKLKPLNATQTEYFFYYNRGEEPACTNEQATTAEPAGAEAVSTAVTGLEPNQKYTVCLVSVNAFGSEEDPASPVHFETKSPPTIESETTVLVPPSGSNPHPSAQHEVRLEGVVNPNNDLTECHFQYGATSASENTVPCEPELLKGLGGQSVGVNVTGLKPDTTYRYQIVATNGKGEKTPPDEKEFKTAATPAAPNHVFSGEFNGGVGHEFSDPTGVAVNNTTGNVYVVDKGNNRVEEFNSEGGFIAEFKGAGTPGELSEPQSIAVDNSGETASEDPSVGDVYVTDHNVVDKFSATGEYKGQITGTCENEGEVPPSCSKSKFVAFEAAVEGVAVDPKGVVWVSQKETYVDAFSDAQPNAFLFARSNSFILGKVQPALAVNSEDDLYVDHGGLHFVAELNSMGEALELPAESGRTGVAVEPSSNDVYIDSANPQTGAPEIKVYEPGKPGWFEQGSQVETFGEAQLADSGGTALAVSYANVSSSDVYVVDSAAGKVDIFTPPKATAYFLSSSFTGEGAHALSEPEGVAVNDETEDVYVADKGNKRVEEFSSTGTYITEFAPPGGFGEPVRIAVDNTGNPLDPSEGDVYVADNAKKVIDKFSSTGTYEGQLPAGFHPEYTLTGVAVDPEGNVWVGYEYPFEGIFEFSDTGIFERSLGSYSKRDGVAEGGLAVGAGEIAYLGGGEVGAGGGNLGGEVVKFGLSPGEPLSAAFGGRGTSALALAPSTGDLFVDKATEIQEYAPVEESSPAPLTTFATAGFEESHGVAVSSANTVYATERLAAGSVEVFNEAILPQVAVGALSGLGPESVTLEGSVDPEGKKVSSCEFEYGTTTSYGHTAECEPAAGSLGEGSKPVLVGAKLSGLASGTTYHYRLVASGADGTNRGSDHVFTTPGPEITEEHATYVEATSATLHAQINPHAGATSYHFEYDTTPYTSSAPHGTDLPAAGEAIGSGTSAVSVSVKAQGLTAGTTYYYRAVAEGEPLGAPERFSGPNETFATPVALGSEPPQSCPNEQRRAEQPFGLKLPDCRAYEMVSPVQTGGVDATGTGLASFSRAAVSGEAVTYTSYGSFAKPTGATLENQLLSRRGAEGWTTQSITPLRDAFTGEIQPAYEGIAFTPNLEEGLAQTNDPRVQGAPGGKGENEFGLYVEDFAAGTYQYVAPSSGNLFGASSDLSRVMLRNSEWVNGSIVPVMVTNEGEGINGAVGGPSPGFISEEKDSWQAVSSDGSRVYFTSPRESVEPGTKQLFVRVNIDQPHAGKEQSELNAKECTEPAKACTIKVSAGATDARYWGASADGTKVFFTEGEDLYEYSLPIGQVVGQAKALTKGAKVQGVVQISEEGQYVYFVAKGALKGEHGEALRSASGAEPVAEADNLYVSHEGGAPAFIATLAATDSSDWDNKGENNEEGPEVNSAVVDPSGTELAFLSTNELTGYDDHDANTGQPDGEVYLYEAEAGGLVCASCNPTGARPLGPASLGGPHEAIDEYRARNLLDNGELFFNSSDALVPHASDGRQNVYEYEDGALHAISNVAGGFESFFIDASDRPGEEGTNVFFASTDQLLPQDTSNNVVVWDARVDGGFPVTVAAPPCTTAEACRTASPPTPAVFGAPPSATFSGPGNFTPPPPTVVKPKPKSKTVKCKKGEVKNSKGKCIKKKKSRKAKKSAHINRRAH